MRMNDQLACPNCGASLVASESEAVECQNCGRTYGRNQYGYYQFIIDDSLLALDPVSPEYAHDQCDSGERLFQEFLRPYIEVIRADRVLDVGCGVGVGISRLAEQGHQSYGVDLPSMAKYWSAAGNSTDRFFCADALHLPFQDDHFDLVYSLGVIEHIGTEDGHSNLGPTYRQKKGGRAIVACPNRQFPVDIQHPPREYGETTVVTRLRRWIYDRTGMNIHPVIGEYHLLSYGEVEELFCDNGGARKMRPLPLQGYFGFGRFQSGFLSTIYSISRLYVEHLPETLRDTLLNPYMLVEISK
jgi:SAM-dependent methyltransferase